MDQPAAPAPAALNTGKGTSQLFASSYDATATGAGIGELFSYEAREKVSVPRGQAAMVPILSKQINGRRLLYFKESFSPKPADAFVVRNDTDLTLEAGAITFFEGSTSLGEGILGRPSRQSGSRPLCPGRLGGHNPSAENSSRTPLQGTPRGGQNQSHKR